MKRAPELQMVCGHAQMAADKQKGQCTAAKGCQSCKWSDWHTHPMDGSQDWHTHTHPVLEEPPGTHTQSWKNSQDWRTHPGLAHTHTPSPWTEARTGTHTHPVSPGRTARTGTHTQDWHLLRACTNGCGQVKRATHGCKRAPELQMVCRFAAGMQKWLRASLPKQAEGKGSRKNTYSALLKLRVESVKGRQNLKGYGMLREAAAKSSGQGCGFE